MIRIENLFSCKSSSHSNISGNNADYVRIAVKKHTYLKAKLPSETESEDEVVAGADQKATFDSKTQSGKLQLDNSETVSIDSENSDNEEIICIGCKNGPIKPGD